VPDGRRFGDGAMLTDHQHMAQQGRLFFCCVSAPPEDLQVKPGHILAGYKHRAVGRVPTIPGLVTQHDLAIGGQSKASAPILLIEQVDPSDFQRGIRRDGQFHGRADSVLRAPIDGHVRKGGHLHRIGSIRYGQVGSRPRLRGDPGIIPLHLLEIHPGAPGV